MMLPGDFYEYFWTDKGGFDYLRFMYDADYGVGGPGSLQCQTGSNNVKHLYGDAQDHKDATGYDAANMANMLPTHLLRLGDVFLIYAEACVLTGDAGTALEYVNYIRNRACVEHDGSMNLTSVTWQDIWKERRLELAHECDRWYDFVRRSYYDMDATIAELKAQRRNTYSGLGDVYETYYTEGKWPKSFKADEVFYMDPNRVGVPDWANPEPVPNVTASSFTLPFPTEDVVYNPNVGSSVAAEHVDVRETYKYDF